MLIPRTSFTVDAIAMLNDGQGYLITQPLETKFRRAERSVKRVTFDVPELKT